MGISPALAKKIAESKPSNTGTRIKEGEYVLVVKQIICDEMNSGTMYIPEFDVVAAEKTADTEPNKEGTDCSCAWPVDSPGNAGKAAKANINQFVHSLFELEEGSEEFGKYLTQYSGEKDSADAMKARGRIVLCATRRKKIKTGPNAGTEGIFPEFRPAKEGNSPAEIAERRKGLDAARR